MPRGRPKKNLQKNFVSTDPDPQLSILNNPDSTSTDPNQAAKVVKTVRTEQWTEKPTSVDGVVEVEVDEQEWEEEERDIWDSVFTDFGPNNEDWSIRVWKLPEYRKNGVAKPRSANREFCDDLALTADYMQIIKDGYGPGIYQLELRERGTIRKRKMISIAPFNVPAVRSQNGQAMIPLNGQVSIPALDPMAQVEASLDLITKMRKAFGLNGEQPIQNTQSQGTPLTAETAFMHPAMQNDDVVDILGKKFKSLLKGPTEAGETTTMDLILAGINVLPQMIDKAKGLLIEVINAKNGTIQNGHTTMAAQTMAPIQTPTNPEPAKGMGIAPQGEISPIPSTSQSTDTLTGIPSEQQVINFALNEIMKACARNEHMTPVLNWLIDYEQKHPMMITPLVEQFMAMTPDQVITFLNGMPNGSTYTALSHCKEWIENLQKAIKESTEEEGKGDEETHS